MRPLYLMVSFWGEKFRSYFTSYCLPSLLSPRNLGLLNSKDGHKFLIATTDADWEALRQQPIFAELEKHVEPVFLNIGFPEDDTIASKFEHMTFTHRLLVETAHQRRALVCQIMPDTMYTDGTIATVIRYAEQGWHAVLAVAIRLAEEKLFPPLGAGGFVPVTSSEAPLCITLPPRQVAKIAARSMFYDNLVNDWDAADFSRYPGFCFWRVPGTDDLLIHSFYFAYLLIDFSVVEVNDTKSFEAGQSIENTWLSDNFPDPSKVKVPQDSDEAILLSWTPSPDPIPPRRPRALLRIPGLATIWKGWRLRAYWTLHAAAGDVQKTNNFRHPIHWHAGELTGPEWQRTEARARRIMRWFFGDVFAEYDDVPRWHPLRPVMIAWWWALDFVNRSAPRILSHVSIGWLQVAAVLRGRVWAPMVRLTAAVTAVARIAFRRVGLLVCGDRAAVKWWGWRVRKLMSGLTGQRFEEPRPPAPE